MRLTTVKMSADDAFLINSLNFLWHTSDNSLMIDDDNETISEINAFTRVMSVESETDIAHLSSSHSKKQSKTHDCLNLHTVIESIISFLHHSISFNIALSQNQDEQTVSEDDYEAAATVIFVSIIIVTSPFSERKNQQDSSQNKENWEIMRIVDKRWTRRDCKYKMHWKNTWMSDSELRNATRLVRKFDAHVRRQREGKRSRSTRVEKNRWSMTVSKRSWHHIVLSLQMLWQSSRRIARVQNTVELVQRLCSNVLLEIHDTSLYTTKS